MDRIHLLYYAREGIKVRSNDLLERVLSTGDGVFAVDAEQCITLWNQGAEAILGYNLDDVIGERCFQVIQSVDESGRASCAQDCPIITCARQGQLTFGQNLLVKAKDGSLRWLSLTHGFLTEDGNHLIGIVHVFRDATAEVEAKKLVRKIADQLSGYGHVAAREQAESGQDPALSEREQQVLSLLANGEGTNAIAKELTISKTTARNHIQNILAKLGVHTRLEAVAHALRHRLIDPG